MGTQPHFSIEPKLSTWEEQYAALTKTDKTGTQACPVISQPNPKIAPKINRKGAQVRCPELPGCRLLPASFCLLDFITYRRCWHLYRSLCVWPMHRHLMYIAGEWWLHQISNRWIFGRTTFLFTPCQETFAQTVITSWFHCFRCSNEWISRDGENNSPWQTLLRVWGFWFQQAATTWSIKLVIKEVLKHVETATAFHRILQNTSKYIHILTLEARNDPKDGFKTIQCIRKQRPPGPCQCQWAHRSMCPWFLATAAGWCRVVVGNPLHPKH